MVTTREPFRITLGIEILATRSDIRNCRRHGSRTFGGIRQAALFECLSPTSLLGLRVGALRIAARFFDRSSDTKTFKRGIGAYNNPDFYRQLGKDPEQLVRDALDVL